MSVYIFVCVFVNVFVCVHASVCVCVCLSVRMSIYVRICSGQQQSGIPEVEKCPCHQDSLPLKRAFPGLHAEIK